jgi:hypothetical protein
MSGKSRTDLRYSRATYSTVGDLLADALAVARELRGTLHEQWALSNEVVLEATRTLRLVDAAVQAVSGLQCDQLLTDPLLRPAVLFQHIERHVDQALVADGLP